MDEESTAGGKAQEQEEYYDDSGEDSEPASFFPVQEKSKKKRKSKHRRSNSQSSRSHSQYSRPSDSDSRPHRSSVLTELSQEHRRNHRISSAHETMPSTRRGKSSTPAAASKSPEPTKKKQTAKERVAELEAQLAAAEKENHVQAKKIQVLSSTKKQGNPKSFVFRVPLSKELAERIKHEAGPLGSNLWRTTKFISDKKQLHEATHRVMLDIPDCKKYLEGDDDVVQENIKAFAETYGGFVCKGINDGRSNAQSGLKKAYLDRFDAKLPLPTPAQLLLVIKRKNMEMPAEPPAFDEDGEYEDLDLARQQHEDKFITPYELARAKCLKYRDWFQWYWTELLPKVAGSKRWSQSIRHYGTISEHAPPDDPNRRYITTTDEALVQVLYENCGQRFPYLATLPRSIKERPTDYQKNPKYISAYSDEKCGQQKYGGWHRKGRDRFKDLIKVFRVSKSRPHVAALELQTLEKIRKDLGLDKASSKKRKGRVELDFEGEDVELAPVCLESDAMSEIGDDANSDIDDFDDVYAPIKKKPKAAEPEESSSPSESEADDDEESEEEGKTKKSSTNKRQGTGKGK